MSHCDSKINESEVVVFVFGLLRGLVHLLIRESHHSLELFLSGLWNEHILWFDVLMHIPQLMHHLESRQLKFSK
jgi:hypothetical protein